MWCLHSDFQKIIADVWAKPVYASPLYALHSKLKAVKIKLKDWNINAFGNIFQRVADAEDEAIY